MKRNVAPGVPGSGRSNKYDAPSAEALGASRGLSNLLWRASAAEHLYFATLNTSTRPMPVPPAPLTIAV